jgi:hypothetical protein
VFNWNLTRPAGLPLAGPGAWLSARLKAWATELGGELPLVGALMGIGLVAHGLNMFSYPAFTYKDDEGIYAAQAWAVLREGRLSPYTYFYDHAPGGWLLLAAWMALTGGPDAFGGAIDSGRVLMLLLHLAMVPLLYHLARKLGCGAPMAALAAFLFSVSPLATFYQRLVLLDSMMMFWVLVSLDLLLDDWGRLSRVALSGVCFGLALLTKETAAVLLPALLLLAVRERLASPGTVCGGGLARADAGDGELVSTVRPAQGRAVPHRIGVPGIRPRRRRRWVHGVHRLADRRPHVAGHP